MGSTGRPAGAVILFNPITSGKPLERSNTDAWDPFAKYSQIARHGWIIPAGKPPAVTNDSDWSAPGYGIRVLW
jgi:hypothetical protein